MAAKTEHILEKNALINLYLMHEKNLTPTVENVVLFIVLHPCDNIISSTGIAVIVP